MPRTIIDRRIEDLLDDYDAIAKRLPPTMDHATGYVVAALLLVANRLEAIEEELTKGFPIAGEGV
jgi:hypothetical protein